MNIRTKILRISQIHSTSIRCDDVRVRSNPDSFSLLFGYVHDAPVCREVTTTRDIIDYVVLPLEERSRIKSALKEKKTEV